MIPAVAQAQFTYTIEQGMITISGYTGPGGPVIIPETIDGLPVTAIAGAAFFMSTSLTSVRIPGSVSSIGNHAFYWCTSLTNATIDEGVLDLGDHVFDGCTSLGSVTIPSTVRTMGTGAFSRCYWLTAVYFQGDTPTMPEDTFHATRATLFYLPGTLGWETTSAGRPTALWSGQFGVQAIQIHAGVTITGEVGKIYSIDYVTDANNPPESDWRTLEFLQLAASPYLWTDRTAPMIGKRFYRAVAMAAPTNMVFIPPGTFRMGSPTNELDRSDWEGPQTEVIISRGFWMGRYEVTQGEYEELMGDNPSWFNGPSEPGEDWHPDYGVDPNRPVERVSWEDAVAYCAALTQRERVAGRIPTNGVYRLPTEAEWEYACRAGTSTRFSYGDDPGGTNRANYAWSWEGGTTHPVGQKLPNPWGLYDLHGNVGEWCQDRWELDIDGAPYGFYAGGIALDPQGLGSGPLRALRTGYRSASRDYSLYPDSSIGFRVLLVPTQP